MRLDEFNVAEARTLEGPLLACAPIRSWADALLAGRPYPSLAALLDAAADHAGRWTSGDVAGALAHHPRIGERARTLAPEEAAHSSAEQSGVTDADAWVEANRRYEERFGVIFLIRAAGRTQPLMLAELERRLGNSVKDEERERAEQLAHIALLRLGQLVSA